MTEVRTRPRVVIVGAGYAGMTAAHRLAGRAEITVVSPGEVFVDRIRLHQLAAGSLSVEDVAPKLADVLPEGVRHVRAAATAVAPGLVRLEHGGTVTADHVVVAAGSGVGSGVANLESSSTTRRALERLPARALVLIRGAGHTGVELAAEIAEQRPDLRVSLTDPAGVLPHMSPRVRRKAERHLERAGVTLLRSADLVPDADLVVDCTGFATPAIDGLSAPDDTLAFGPGLWVAGDIAPTGHRWSCAAAEPMGAHVADNIVRIARGAEPLPFRFGFAIQCVSLGRRRGIVQTVRPDDTPRGIALTGRPAAFVKEWICAMARRVATGSARSYRWPKGPTLHDMRPPVDDLA